MKDRQRHPDSLRPLGSYATSTVFPVAASEVRSAGGLVLSGQRYCEEGYRARQLLARSGFQITPVGDVYSLRMPTRFARVRVDVPEHGVAFVTGSAALLSRPDKTDLISRTLTPDLSAILLREGQVVVTRSGTVGNVAIITSDMVGFAGTDDLIRVEAKSSAFAPEFFYVFALAPLGHALITKDTYGGVVDHIEPDHLASARAPIYPRVLRDELTRLIREACRLRVEANKLLDEAEVEVQRSCYLPDIASFKPRNLRSSAGDATVFSARSADRLSPGRGYGALRCDATYHDPIPVAVSRYILGKMGGMLLEHVLAGVRNSTLRRRNYVDDPELGVPLIGGKQLLQWRPTNVKYLSKALTRHLPQETVQEGWTLVSCGGTLGRTILVHRNFEGWAASQHVMRIMPDPEKVFPGFVYAFLASPYGQVQVQQRSYGSVIPEIRDFQFNSIAICLPADRGQAIHHKVVAAFDARADARQHEDAAIDLFMSALKQGREYVETEWGREY